MHPRNVLLEVHVFPQHEHHRDNAGGSRINGADHEIRRKDGLVQRRHDGHRKIPGNDAVHGDRQRNDQHRQEGIGPAQAVPLFVGATPTQGEQYVHVAAPAAGAVPHRGEIRDRAHVNENRAAGQVGSNRHHVEQQR